MLLAVRISSYGCTWEVWRALKKLELLSAAPGATLTLLSCSPNFPRASITRYTHAKHEPILKFYLHMPCQAPSEFRTLRLQTRERILNSEEKRPQNTRCKGSLIFHSHSEWM